MLDASEISYVKCVSA